MVKNLTIVFVSFFILACEAKNLQIIKPEKFTYDIVKFKAVSKVLNNEFKNNSPDHEIISEIVQYWFDNRVKTDGFEGDLYVNVKSIQFINP